MNTDTTPTRDQVLEWLADGAVEAVSDGGTINPYRIVWAMLAASLRRPGEERSKWVATWLRWANYQGASTKGARAAVLAVLAGKKSKAIAPLLGRTREEFDRTNLYDFKARFAVIVAERLSQQFGIIAHPKTGSFIFTETVGS